MLYHLIVENGRRKKSSKLQEKKKIHKIGFLIEASVCSGNVLNSNTSSRVQIKVAKSDINIYVYILGGGAFV